MYSDYESPRQLTSDQFDLIFRTASHSKVKDRRIWFVLVVCNSRPLLASPYLRAKVYYAPDESSPRIRKGRFVGIDKGSEESTYEGIYLQVSRSDHALTEKLEIPDLREMPFGPPRVKNGPVQMTDEELVRLVDFVRARLDANAGVEFRANEPILSISGDRDLFEVRSGWIAANTSGRGRTIHVKRADGGFQQIGNISWFRS